jgi:hypothetical protein
MASESENSVSVELRELLELLNALDFQDNRPIEAFATLERLLAAGKAGAADALSGQHPSDDFSSEVPGGVANAGEQSSSEEPAAEDERPGTEIENRLAVHIVQGMRKSIKGRTL